MSKGDDDQCVPDNVRTMARAQCGKCGRPILKGQFYFNVRVPDGSETPVHDDCLESGSAPA